MKKNALQLCVTLGILIYAACAAGQVIDPPIPVADDQGQQGWVQVACDPVNNRYLAVWEDYRSWDSTGCDIYGQLVNWDGTLLGDEFLVCTDSSDQYWPHLDFDPYLERYLVVYEDYRTGWPGNVLGTFISSEGEVVPIATSGPDGSFPISTADGGVYGPAVAYNFLEHVYLVAWADMRGNDPDVYGQLVTAEGELINPANSAENFPICEFPDEQWTPDVTFCSITNEFLVVFPWGNMDDSKVYGQRIKYDAEPLRQDGSVGYDPMQLSDDTGLWPDGVACGAQYNTEFTGMVPQKASMGYHSEAMVVWTKLMPDYSQDIYAQRLAFYAHPLAVLFGWTPAPGVDGQYFAAPINKIGQPDSSMQLANFPVCSAPSCQEIPDISYSAFDNEFGIIWGDNRVGDWSKGDVYFQRAAVMNDLSMEFRGADRINTVSSDENIPVATTDAFEGCWNISGIAHNPNFNEFFTAYTYSPDINEPDSSDLHGKRIGGTLTGIRDITDSELPLRFAVHQNYPNPFNPHTTITFTLPSNERVFADVFDLMGRKIKTLLDEEREKGIHSIRWDATNQSGAKVPSGIYFYRVHAGDYSETRKMMLIK